MFATKSYLPGGQRPLLLPQYHSRHVSYQPYSGYQQQQQQPQQHLPPPQQQQYQHQHSMSYSAAYDLNDYYSTPYGSAAPSVVTQPTGNDYYMPSSNQQQQQLHLPPPPPPIQEQPVEETQPQSQPTGGVSSILDYDMDQMVRFVSWLCYGLMKRSDNPSTSFHNTVKSVLAATRLPKSTIVLALLYLSDKMEYQEEPIYGDSEVFQNLTISLVLANKFNDDNTFRNKSWSDATGLDVLLINSMERSWLCEIKWRLHYEDGYACIEECWKTWCEKFQVKKSNTCTPVLPSLDAIYNVSSPVETTAYQQQQQQRQLPSLINHQPQIPSYDMKSPSNSLFSENSQFSPVHTPSNSSPWFSDYQQPQSLQQPAIQQQQAFENPYQVQYNASLVAQQVSSTGDYYSMYNQLNHHPVMKPQHQSQHSVYLNNAGSLPPTLNQTPATTTPLPLPLLSTQAPTSNTNNRSHQRYYSLGHFHNQSSSQIPSMMMSTGTNSFYNNNSSNDYHQQFYSNPNNYCTASAC